MLTTKLKAKHISPSEARWFLEERKRINNGKAKRAADQKKVTAPSKKVNAGSKKRTQGSEK